MIEQFAQNKSSLLLKNRDGRGHKHAHYRSRELSYGILEVQNWYRELMYQNVTVFSGRGEKFQEYWVDTIRYKLPMVSFRNILKLYCYMFQFSISTLVLCSKRSTNHRLQERYSDTQHNRLICDPAWKTLGHNSIECLYAECHGGTRKA
jgi:hypothetical protein